MRFADSVPSSQDLIALAGEVEEEAVNVFIQEGAAVLPLTDAMFDHAARLRKVYALPTERMQVRGQTERISS